MRDTIGLIFGWDLFAAAVFAALFFFGPMHIPNSIARDLYNAGISVLGILFAVFLAALATFASGSDNEFVKFLEEDRSYSALIAAFKINLFLLLVGLLASLFGYGLTSFADVHGSQNHWFLTGFVFISLWSLFATLNTALDGIRYAQSRAIFLHRK
jgi:hypothetical protein